MLCVSLQASAPLQHRLLDPTGEVQGHTDLNQWTAHSDLGRIVSEIVGELRLALSSANHNVPPPASPVESNSSRASSSSVNLRNSASRYPSPSVKPPQTPPHQQPPPAPMHKLQRSQVPAIPAVFPDLEELSYVDAVVCILGRVDIDLCLALAGSISQLENLAQDKHAMKAFAKNMDTVKEFIKTRDDAMHNNMRIAQKTLTYEEELRDLQSEVEALRSELRAAQESLAAKQARQQRVVSVRWLAVLACALVSCVLTGGLA